MSIKINKNTFFKNIRLLGFFLGFLACFVLGSSVYAQSAPGQFSISSSGCVRWTPSPAIEVNFFTSAGATDYAADRRIFGTSSWTRISSVNNLPVGSGPIRLTDTGDLDDYTVSGGNTYEYRLVAVNSSGQTASSNTAVVQVNQTNCSPVAPPPPACTTSFSPTSVLLGGTTTQSWTSSSDADGSLQYSCSGNMGFGTLPANGSRTVSPTTTQVCTVTAVSSSNTTANCSGGITVTTPLPPPPSSLPPPPPPDITPPTITNVRITNITTTTATVLWDTDEPADSQVEFCPGLTRCGVNTPLAAQLVTNHSVNLSGLTAGTTYAIWVKSKDGASNLRTLGYFLFATLGQPTPTPSFSSTPTTSPPPSGNPPTPVIISNVQVTNITRDSATVTWDTDRPADSHILSCFLFWCFSDLAFDPSLTISHSLNISGLRADSNQYIEVVSKDNGSNYGYSNVISFRTQPGLVISNLRSTNITQTSFTIAWDTNYPANTRIVSCTFYFFCFFAAPVVDTTLTLSHSITVPNLKLNSVYYYWASSIDPSGYKAQSALISVRTSN